LFTLISDAFLFSGERLAGSLLWVGVGILPTYLLAVWLARRRPDHPQTRRLLVLAASGAVGVTIENTVALAYDGADSDGWLVWANLAGQLLGLTMGVTAALMFATYPDGVVERRWQRLLIRAAWGLLAVPILVVMLTNPAVPLDRYLAYSAAVFAAPPTELASPLFLPVLAPLGPVALVIGDPIVLGVLAIGLLGYRHLTAPAAQRRRMRVLTYPLIASIPVLLASIVLRALGVPGDSPALRAIEALYLPFLLAIPVSIVVGVLRYRLYDIDLIVRRSFVYGALTVGITLAYIGLAVAPGLALGDQIPVQLAVVLTILAAIAFHPLRRRLEHLADRWVFGERVNRYRLLTEFGAGLEHTIAVPDLLPRLARAVQDGLRAPWVRVSVSGVPDAVAGPAGGEVGLAVPMESRRLPGAVSADRPEGDVSDGDLPGPPGRLELGRIECGARPDWYDEQDRELLATLAGQAAAAIANVRLSAELAERFGRAGPVPGADRHRRLRGPDQRRQARGWHRHRGRPDQRQGRAGGGGDRPGSRIRHRRTARGRPDQPEGPGRGARRPVHRRVRARSRHECLRAPAGRPGPCLAGHCGW